MMPAKDSRRSVLGHAQRAAPDEPAHGGAPGRIAAAGWHLAGDLVRPAARVPARLIRANDLAPAGQTTNLSRLPAGSALRMQLEVRSISFLGPLRAAVKEAKRDPIQVLTHFG